MTKALQYLGLLLFLPFWWAQWLLPLKKNLWIFGAWNGHRFSDNSRYLYEYVVQNHPEIDAVWLTRESHRLAEIRKSGGKAYQMNSLSGILSALFAQVVLVSSGKKDVNHYLINGATLVHLWHGNPLKKIGMDDKYSAVNSFQYRYLRRYLFPMTYEFNYDYIISNAPVFSGIMASSYRIPIERVLETGCPRNDVFFREKEDVFNSNLRKTFKGCRLLYYLPTFRSLTESRSLFTLDDYDRDILEAFLERENMIFVSKGHYVDNNLYDEGGTSNSRVFHLSDDQVSDINYMLKDADLLITDYSSAYFDFLLTERPIIFAAFDLEEYLSNSRELYFDYDEAIAGPIAENWSQLFRWLQDIWDNTTFLERIRLKNKLFNKYHDTRNSERGYYALKERLN
jgi:CDP-glycerol glycerophosphotransferase (TagB/SpsB family)